MSIHRPTTWIGVLTVMLCCLLVGCGGTPEKKEDDPETKLVKRYEAALKMSDAQTKSEELLSTATEQLKLGALTGATKSLSAAYKAIEKVTSPVYQARFFADLAITEARAKRTTEARTAISSSQGAITRIKNDALGVVMAKARLAMAYRELKSETTANETLADCETAAATITELDQQTRAWMDLARVHHFFGNTTKLQNALQESLKSVDQISDPRTHSDMLVEAAAQLMNLTENDRAVSLLDKATAAARTITDPLSRGFGLVSIADGYIRADKIEQGEAILKEIDKIMPTIKEPDIKTQLKTRLGFARATIKYKSGKKE